ncbi:MAG: selenocysteine-specific translation elongation factor [Deltaproteobacteria bacterium]|jgi:selenocysteine-specific elongation factor|nr:selenocysteine-specific translation elongation factor [Deltaproteobacteria bacterium]
MKQIILGTAGHIDHGKTSLIKAVTGTNTDRLKEEQLRGITIELGFASLDLPSGRHLGIVDVPGHEKFVKNMVAGATGIDMVAMVIAADEGVMPQTREHMEICSLLGVEHGLVALTKIDMIDAEWLELVEEDIRDFTAGTFLEDKPIVPVSSASGEGIDAFVSALDDLSGRIPERPSSNLFRLPVDRVFTMKGFGTVITGSLMSGTVKVGDNVMIYPSGIPSKVRGVQVHGEPVETAHSGMRTAINFQGLEKASIERGQVLSTANALLPSYMVDVSLHYLESNKKKIKNRSRVRFHTGTSEIMGNVILLDQEDLRPGEDTVAQIRLDAPVAVVRDDRFVLRSYSPVRTIGGGQVLNPVPEKHKRFRPEVVQGLKGLMTQDPEEIITYHVRAAGVRGVSFSALMIMTNLSEKPLDKYLQAMLSKKDVIQIDKEQRLFVHKVVFEELQKDTANHLQAYHDKNPLKAGMPKEELKSKLPATVGPRVFTMTLNQMTAANTIAQEGDSVRLTTHKVSLGEDQAGMKKKISALYLENGLQPPYFKEVLKTLDFDASLAKDVLMLLVAECVLIKAKEELYFHSEPMRGLKEKLIAYLKTHGEITTPQFKEMTQASRKYVIPLLEYFDANQVTLRVGDSRKLRQQR